MFREEKGDQSHLLPEMTPEKNEHLNEISGIAQPHHQSLKKFKLPHSASVNSFHQAAWKLGLQTEKTNASKGSAGDQMKILKSNFQNKKITEQENNSSAVL